MELEPRLIDVATPQGAVASVLVLHGGASRGEQMAVSSTQVSVLRMIPIAKRIAREGGTRLSVHRVLNSHRGWDTHHTPVMDVSWALDQLAERPGGLLPTCLVGHSLGGRAALLAASHPAVRSVVALAPWVTSSDRPTGLAGKDILIVHGSDDRIARPERSAAMARRIDETANINYVTVEGGRHAMLRHHAEFSGRAARFAVETLLG